MRRYCATALMCLKEKGYFGLGELIGQHLIRAATLFALLAVWRALFRQGLAFDGLRLSQMLAYTALGNALEPMLNVRTPASSWLHDGAMLSLYLRPAPIFGQLAAHTVGGWLAPLGCYGVPALALCALLGVDLAPASPWCLLSLALCVFQGFAVDFLFAALLMRLKNLEWVVHSLREALSATLTGALIPFAALPWGIGRWLALSPLGTLSGAPLAIFTGLARPERLIPAQLLWVAVLWPLARLAFAKSRERLVSYGG